MFVAVGLLAFIGLFMFGMSQSATLDKDTFNAALAVGLLAGFIWFASAIVLAARTIRATRMTDEWTDLVNVHEAFRDALNHSRPKSTQKPLSSTTDAS